MVIGQYSDLSEKTILVTGASSGIGKTVAIALSAQGSHVIVTGRNTEKLNETLSQLNSHCQAIEADLTQPEERHNLVESLPPLDGICHAAGIIHPFPVRMLQEAQLEKVMAINFTAPVLLTSALLKQRKLNDKASLVFISSIGSEYSSKGSAAYSASKAALEAYSRNITLENTTRKIRANCIKPALVRTEIFEHALQISAVTGFHFNEKEYPLGIGIPEDVAAAALFLLSDASRWISSTTLVLDGGLTAGV